MLSDVVFRLLDAWGDAVADEEFVAVADTALGLPAARCRELVLSLRQRFGAWEAGKFCDLMEVRERETS